MIWWVLLVALAALVVVALVAWPLVGARPDAPAPDPDAEARRDLDEQLGLSLEAIREIEMDHRAGNLSDEDFAALDRAERARAVELMRRAAQMQGKTAADMQGKPAAETRKKPADDVQGNDEQA